MRPLSLFQLAAALLASALVARASMQDALVGAQMLTGVAEAYVVRLDPTPSVDGPRKSSDRPTPSEKKPEPVYGVLFSFEGCSWFYAAECGTRVVAPLAKDWLDPDLLKTRLARTGIVASNLTIYPRVATSTALPGQSTIGNACVIACLSILQQRLAADQPTESPALVLLSYRILDASTAMGFLVDHAVLAFRTDAGWRCIDPRTPDREVGLSTIEIGTPVDSALISLALRPRYPLKSARLLTLGTGTIEHITRTTLWRSLHPQPEITP